MSVVDDARLDAFDEVLSVIAADVLDREWIGLVRRGVVRTDQGVKPRGRDGRIRLAQTETAPGLAMARPAVWVLSEFQDRSPPDDLALVLQCLSRLLRHRDHEGRLDQTGVYRGNDRGQLPAMVLEQEDPGLGRGPPHIRS